MIITPRLRLTLSIPTLTVLFAALLSVSAASAQVVLPPVAPPKPAVARNPNATTIGTGDLSEALNFAVQGRLADTRTSFNLFKEDWAVVAAEVRRQSSDLADVVEDAIADVQDVVDAQPEPPQARYLPAIQFLSGVIEEANVRLGELAPASGAIRIPSPDLAQSVTWATQANLAKAHDEFDQFRDEWTIVRQAVGGQLPAVATSIDAATAVVQSLIANPARPDPAQSEYLPALQNLLQLVNGANAQLATLAPPAAAAPATITIRTSDLNEAVELAGDEDLDEARGEFEQFVNRWTALAGAVRVQHAPLADQVEEAIANVQSILAASEPPKTDYFPALQQLQQIVEAANQELASSSPQAAPVMAAVTRIRDADLAEAADLAGEGNQARARSEFAQFQRTWTEVRGALREQLPSVVDRIDAAVARTERELAQEPAMQSEYAAALETLLQLVGEANAQLGN